MTTQYLVLLTVAVVLMVGGFKVRMHEPETSLKHLLGRTLYLLGAGLLLTTSLWSTN